MLEGFEALYLERKTSMANWTADSNTLFFDFLSLVLAFFAIFGIGHLVAMLYLGEMVSGGISRRVLAINASTFTLLTIS